MFFRRERPKPITFEERLEDLRKAGFTTQSANGRVLVTRNGCGAVLENTNGILRFAEKAGILIDGSIAKLVDGGFQKFFLTTSGKKKPAVAEELQEVHAFEEQLREDVA